MVALPHNRVKWQHTGVGRGYHWQTRWKQLPELEVILIQQRYVDWFAAGVAAGDIVCAALLRVGLTVVHGRHGAESLALRAYRWLVPSLRRVSSEVY